MRGTLILASALLLLASGSSPARPVERDTDDVGAPELGAALRRYFGDRLRAELALSDEQMAAIQPRLEQLERTRAASRVERLDATRSLRWGLERGASDDELQGWLDRVERLDREHLERERAILAEIDETLAVRQRVKLRFFIERFRREMQERVRQLREGQPPARRFGPPERRSRERRP